MRWCFHLIPWCAMWRERNDRISNTSKLHPLNSNLILFVLFLSGQCLSFYLYPYVKKSFDKVNFRLQLFFLFWRIVCVFVLRFTIFLLIFMLYNMNVYFFLNIMYTLLDNVRKRKNCHRLLFFFFLTQWNSL